MRGAVWRLRAPKDGLALSGGLLLSCLAATRAGTTMLENLAELYRYRALIGSLVVRELAVRYRGSVLGFLWTFLNPLLSMAVYSLVFSVYMRNPMENYTYFLFVGLLPWMWFGTCVSSGTSSISDRRDLVSKVRFPPQTLPVVVILSSLCNYLLSLPLMFGLALLTGASVSWTIVTFPLIVAVQLLFTTGLVYVTSSINVVFRDLQHILPNLLQFAFFLTPVLYSAEQIPERYRELLLKANPMATLIGAYQDVFFHGRLPDFIGLGIVASGSVLLLVVGSKVMALRRESFAEVV